MTSRRDAAARQRELRAWELRVHGWTQERIATELGCDRSTVSKAIARAERRVLAEIGEEVLQFKASQLARLDHLYDEAMQEWERSKLPRKSQTRKLAPDADGKEQVEQVVQHITEQGADVGILDRLLAILADQRRLLGLDMPQKIALTDPSGTKTAGRGLLEGMADELREMRNWMPESAPTPVVPAQPEPPPDGVCPAPVPDGASDTTGTGSASGTGPVVTD